MRAAVSVPEQASRQIALSDQAEPSALQHVSQEALTMNPMNHPHRAWHIDIHHLAREEAASLQHRVGVRHG
jgi:hypothetical protein